VQSFSPAQRENLQSFVGTLFNVWPSGHVFTSVGQEFCACVPVERRMVPNTVENNFMLMDDDVNDVDDVKR